MVSFPVIGSNTAVPPTPTSANQSASASPAGPPRNHLADSSKLIIGRRTTLPNRRAIAGGLLVALAVLGTFALSASASADGRRPYVIAARDLSAGHVVGADDVALVRLSLDGSVAQSGFTGEEAVVGATLVGPIRSGELVQAGSVSTRREATGLPQISFAIPAARALGGDLKSGETIDVLFMAKNSDAGFAEVAVSDATVAKVAGNSGSVGRNGEVTVTLTLRNRTEAAALVAALNSGTVTLGRTTGVPVTP